MLRHEHVDKTLDVVVAVAGGIERDQQTAIVYLLEENRVLKARLRRRKLRLIGRRATSARYWSRELGRKLVADVAGIVTPDPLLAWHRAPLRFEFSVPFVFKDTTGMRLP